MMLGGDPCHQPGCSGWRGTVNSSIGSCALSQSPAEWLDEIAKGFRSHPLAMGSPCSAGDIFVHQGAAEVVAPGVEKLTGSVLADLHPRELDVVDQASICDPGNSMNKKGLSESRAATGSVLEVDG